MFRYARKTGRYITISFKIVFFLYTIIYIYIFFQRYWIIFTKYNNKYIIIRLTSTSTKGSDRFFNIRDKLFNYNILIHVEYVLTIYYYIACIHCYIHGLSTCIRAVYVCVRCPTANQLNTRTNLFLKSLYVLYNNKPQFGCIENCFAQSNNTVEARTEKHIFRLVKAHY